MFIIRNKTQNNTIMKKITLFLALILISSIMFAQQTARVQVIHNSADLAADTVDVWLNDQILFDNFAFRTASPFIDAPAGTAFDISIQPKNSTDTVNALARFTYTLAANQTYVIIASGIVSGSGYSPATPFDLHVYNMGQEMAMNSGETDVMVFHGSTDAPIVDVKEVGVGAGTIVDDAAYGDFTGYLNLPTADYSLQIRDASGMNTVAQFGAPLSTLNLADSALVVVASGFLNPANNSNGPAFGLYAALPTGGDLVQLPAEPISTARVQVIHNSADMAADTVDVWLNDQLLLDNFAFRTASPFIDAPAGTPFDISIQGKNSTDTVNAIAQYTYTLTGGEKYVIVANGIVSGSGYTPATPFDLHVYNMGQEMAMNSGETDVMVFHGSTDAPVVDVKEVGVGAGTIVDDAAYGDFTGYLNLPTADYSLQIRDASGMNTVAQFGAPLSTLNLADSALVVVASGFLNPANNSNGPAFGLYAALPTGGDLVQLPAEPISTARVQVIHNSADMAADTVDVWLNDQLLLDNFAFRTASPFIDAPAGTPFDISIQGKNSTDTVNAIAQYTYTLTGGEKYVIVASGIVSGSGYSPATPFDLHVYNMGQEMAMNSGETDVMVFHGSTDAPIVDVKEVAAGAGTIVDNAAYGDFSGYLNLPTADYSLQIRDSSGMNTVAQFGAPLSTLNLADSALVVLASGFLNPANNSNGPAFGLYAALPTGGDLVQLPAEPISTARVQVIHNSADIAADTVDVWLNDQLLLDNFTFRTATPFIDAPANELLNIGIAPSNSTSWNQSFRIKQVSLTGNQTYIVITGGIISTSGYMPAKPFYVNVYPGAREVADDAAKTDILVHHGSTDAPVVDVAETSVPAGTLVSALEYENFDGYLSLDPMDYVLAIKDNASGNTVVSYDAPLQSLNLQGSAITVIASGFLSPSSNSNGEAFGLYVATSMGGELIPLPETTSSGVEETENSFAVYPNPADNYLNIKLENASEATSTINIYDLSGKQVLSQNLPVKQKTIQVNTELLKNGLYFLTIVNSNTVMTKKIQISR